MKKLITILEKVSKEKYGGHYTIMKFTTNYRVCFGTINDREEVENMHEGKTLKEAIIKCILNEIECQ